MDNQPLHILLVEDDAIDSEKIVRCLGNPLYSLELTEACNAATALAILRDQVRSGFLDRPYIILLDLDLPGITGLEFLSIVRQDVRLSYIPIFVLTASDNPTDKAAAYSYGIAGYLLKDRLDLQGSQLLELLAIYGQLNRFVVPLQSRLQRF